MATEQVLNWIGGAYCPPGQEPLKLSKSIQSFEEDFSNGYLFGEILSQYGVCESIVTFSKKTNKEAKVHNFFQVEEGLRMLKVPFDAKLIHQIMQEERGASLRLLYQLKLSLDRHFSKSDMTVTNLRQNIVDAKVKKVQDLAAKLPKIHKQYGVEGPTIRGKNFKKIEEKLLKYEVARANLEKKAIEDDLAEKNMLSSLQQTKRQEALRKMQENKEFMQDWESEGRQNWRTNRETRAKEIARQLYFEDREIKIYKDKLSKQLDYHTSDLISGVEQFEENLQKLGVEQNITIQEAMKRQEEKKGIPPGQIQNFSYAATMNKIKETKNNNEFAGKERERRNRKMQVDQRKIQETLDAKKAEEELIQRLLEKQQKEQEEAYTRWRNQKCRDIVVENRRSKAEEAEKKKVEVNKEIYERMQKEAEEAEPGRQKKYSEDKIKFKQTRRADKMKKRRVNIEIASEVLDLIMDVADEAFDFQEKMKAEGSNQQLTKPIWREWMNIFSDGKKVSEQNMVINKDDEDEGVGRQLSLFGQVDDGDEPLFIPPQKLINDVKNEPVYDSLLQYIGMCGPLNLRLLAPDRWHLFKKIVETDENLKGRNLDLQYLDELFLPKSSELGKAIENMYKGENEHMETTALGLTKTAHQLSQTEGSIALKSNVEFELAQKEFTHDFPTYHPIKICMLGKAQSGKRTHAKLLQEKYPSLDLFVMDDILREALLYVNPAGAKDEAADPKAKGKPPAGKQAEAPADIFAGKDSTKYKEIANVLLNQVKLVTGNQDSLPGKDTDLVSLISDDQLLVQLFIQKLKLTYPATGRSDEEVEQEMREKIVKEKDLIEQLEEAKMNETVETDAKNKTKGGKSSAKSPTELNEEIQSLLGVQAEGWILVDFPRNLNQAKLLENNFTGYLSITDAPKTDERQTFEVISKFVDPDNNTKEGYDGRIEAQPSLFDAIFTLEASKDECFRRAQGCKIDPTSGAVYHPEDNPAPEGDAKLAERLVPHFGNFQSEEDMIQKLDRNHIQFSDSESSLKKFLGEFAHFDTTKGIKVLQQISVKEKQPKQDTFDQILQSFKEVLAFKKIAQDRTYQMTKFKVQEEEAKAQAEAELAADPNASASQAVSVQDSKANISLNETKAKEEADAILEEGKDEDASPDKVDEEGADVVSDQQFAGAIDNQLSKDTIGSKQIQSALSQSKISHGDLGTSKRGKRVQYTREHKIKIWEEMSTSYIKDGIIVMNDLRRQSDQVIHSLNNCQSEFIQFLERSCKKQELVNEFVSNFHKFSQEFPDLRKDDQTKEELQNRVQALSNSLWDVIESRKNESIDEIKRMSHGGWSDKEMRQLVKNMASLVEIEIKKFTTIYQIIMQSEPPVELDAEILTKKLLERGVQAYNGEIKQSPVLNQVIASLIQKLEDITTNNASVQQIRDDMQGRILEQEKKIFTYRLCLINSWALVTLEEIYTNSQTVYQQLDDWIVEAVYQENHICHQVLQMLKEAVVTEQLKIEEHQYTLPSLNLFDRIQMMHFDSGEKPMYMRNITIPTDNVESCRFKLENLSEIYQEMRYNTGEKGSVATLDSQSFVNIVLLAVRQGRMPLSWKYLSFEQITSWVSRFQIQPLGVLQQKNADSPTMYQSQSKGLSSSALRTWVNWKKIFTFFVLISSPIPCESELAEYRVRLTDNGEKQFINKAQFVMTESWFDNYEGKPDSALEAKWLAERKAAQIETDSSDEEEEASGLRSPINKKLDQDRIRGIKFILFDIYRDKSGEDKLFIPDFIDSLIEISEMCGSDTTFGNALTSHDY